MTPPQSRNQSLQPWIFNHDDSPRLTAGTHAQSDIHKKCHHTWLGILHGLRATYAASALRLWSQTAIASGFRAPKYVFFNKPRRLLVFHRLHLLQVVSSVTEELVRKFSRRPLVMTHEARGSIELLPEDSRALVDPF